MRGVLFFTASIATFDGQIGQIVYSASKGVLVGMTLPLALDLAFFGVRVVSIVTGLFETPVLSELSIIVKHDLGSSVPCPEEFGSLVGHILTSSMINGECIRLGKCNKSGNPFVL